MSNTTLKKAQTDELVPGDVFHPGVFLAEEIEVRGIKQTELATMLGVLRSDVSLVINGRRNMTIAMALKLEKALGIAAETWMNFQMRFEVDRMRKRMAP